MKLLSPRVSRVEPEGDYRLRLWFANGEERVFDLTPYLDTGVFRALKDTAAFCDVRVSMGAVCWGGGQDLSPDTLYLDSVPADPYARDGAALRYAIVEDGKRPLVGTVGMDGKGTPPGVHRETAYGQYARRNEPDDIWLDLSERKGGSWD